VAWTLWDSGGCWLVLLQVKYQVLRDVAIGVTREQPRAGVPKVSAFGKHVEPIKASRAAMRENKANVHRLGCLDCGMNILTDAGNHTYIGFIHTHCLSQMLSV